MNATNRSTGTPGPDGASPAQRFEIDDLLSVRYSYHYGAITPFFQQLSSSAPAFGMTGCEPCGLRFCPPRHHCAQCWQETTWTSHDGTGTIESLVWAYWVPYDSPARQWTDLPYPYAAVRLDGCVNLLRTRVTGLDPAQGPVQAAGLRGRLRVVPGATARPGDLYFEVSESS